MKKALLVTTVSGFVPQFEMRNVKTLQKMGYEVHYAANYNMPSYGNDNSRMDGTGIIRHQIDFIRSPYDLKNLEVYRQMVRLMEQEKFDLVHCHTPMGSVMGRLAAHRTGTGPVIYTAHGFHFFKGAPLVNWLCYYPMERLLSRYTDCLICINEEDYNRAKKEFHAKRVTYIPGVGVDTEFFENLSVDREKKLKEFGISPDKVVLLSVGEMTPNKNQALLLRALAELKDPDIFCILCGKGTETERLQRLAKELQIENQVIFAGYRRDACELYHASDIFVFPSLREGMSVAVMEAMACGLPVICSAIRGNRELIQNGKGGILLDGHRLEDYSNAIRELKSNAKMRKEMGSYNQTAVEKYDYKNVVKIVEQVYRETTHA